MAKGVGKGNYPFVGYKTLDDIDSHDRELLLSVYENDSDRCTLALYSGGANVNLHVDGFGPLPLQHALFNGFSSVMQILVDNGANIPTEYYGGICWNDELTFEYHRNLSPHGKRDFIGCFRILERLGVIDSNSVVSWFSHWHLAVRHGIDSSSIFQGMTYLWRVYGSTHSNDCLGDMRSHYMDNSAFLLHCLELHEWNHDWRVLAERMGCKPSHRYLVFVDNCGCHAYGQTWQEKAQEEEEQDNRGERRTSTKLHIVNEHYFDAGCGIYFFGEDLSGGFDERNTRLTIMVRDLSRVFHVRLANGHEDSVLAPDSYSVPYAQFLEFVASKGAQVVIGVCPGFTHPIPSENYSASYAAHVDFFKRAVRRGEETWYLRTHARLVTAWLAKVFGDLAPSACGGNLTQKVQAFL